MEAVQGFFESSFNFTATDILGVCFSAEVHDIQTMTDGALDNTIQAAQSAPWQAFSGLTLACAMGLLFLGWYLVRAVNFFGGFYLGSSLALLSISIIGNYSSALSENCIAMLSIVAATGLLAAVICVIKRKSMYLVLGLIAGEIIGKFFYHLLLEPTDAKGTMTMMFSVGFFMVLGAYAVKEIGDLAWMVCTALMGAYFATTALVELVVVPFVPEGENYGAFLAYRPTPKISDVQADVKNVVASKYLWAPFGVMMLLTLIGLLTQLACYNQMMRKKARYHQPLVAP